MGWRSRRVVGERYRSQMAEARLEGLQSTLRDLIFGEGVAMAISVPELSQRSDDLSFQHVAIVVGDVDGAATEKKIVDGPVALTMRSITRAKRGSARLI